MKKIFYVSSFLLFCFLACKNADKKETTQSENDLDAVRNFLQSALYGDYEKAKIYMLPDSANEERMNAVERIKRSPEEQKGLSGASINIHNVNPVNDSTTIVIYSNSFKNNRDTLKVVKLKGQWLVDFKYLFEHDDDSLITPSINKTDTIRK